MARQQVALHRGRASQPSRREPCLKQRRFSAILTFVLLGFGCSDPPTHPPLVDPCAGTACPLLGGIGQGSSRAGAGGSGAGVGGGANGGSVNNGTLRGSVVDLVDDTFRTTIARTDGAIIEAQGSSQPIVSAEWNGIDPFMLSGLQTALSITWISVRPKNGNASIRTITPISTGLAAELSLPLVQTDVIDAMFQSLSTPTTRTSGAGHLVVSFVSSRTGGGIAGVRVTAGSAAVVAYRLGGAWSTDATQTDSSGLVLVGNLSASAFPGTSVTLTLSGVVSTALSFAVASDAVTVPEVALSI